jgi:hypothetical protein
MVAREEGSPRLSCLAEQTSAHVGEELDAFLPATGVPGVRGR